MVYVWPQSFLLSLFLILFLINSSCARSNTMALIHLDGHAISRHDPHCHEFYNGKVTSQTNSEEQMMKMLNIAKEFKQESHATKEITPIKKVSLEKCVSEVKVSRISDQKVRKLLPRQRDMDEFVAYADYKGPMHHPPRNN